MSDLETIKAALLAFHRLTEGMKYGGLMRQHELAKRALEAMERIETPRLPGMDEAPQGSDIILKAA